MCRFIYDNRFCWRRWKVIVLGLICLVVLFSFSGCTNQHNNIVYNNELFTEELYNGTTEIFIVMHNGYNRCYIYHTMDKEIIDGFYKDFASFDLEEYTPPPKFPPSANLGEPTYGIIYFVKGEDKETISFVSEVLTKDGTKKYKRADGNLNILKNWFDTMEPPIEVKIRED